MKRFKKWLNVLVDFLSMLNTIVLMLSCVLLIWAAFLGRVDEMAIFFCFALLSGLFLYLYMKN